MIDRFIMFMHKARWGIYDLVIAFVTLGLMQHNHAAIAIGLFIAYMISLVMIDHYYDSEMNNQ